MDSSFWFDTLNLGYIFLCTYLGVYGYNFQKYSIILSEDLSLTLQTVDPDEMPWIWIFTVCKSTHLGGSRIQRVEATLHSILL